MPLLNTPTFQLQPAAERVALSSNYITNFDFLNQYLPDTYEKEFERYGNRTIASFLRLVGAEMPSNSDQIKWAEQGRLHIKYISAIFNAHMTGLVWCILIYGHYSSFNWQTNGHKQIRFIVNFGCKFLKRSLNRAGVAIYIQMIGIGGSHASHIGVQMQKRTVKFIGLDHSYRFASANQIGIVIF